MTTPTKLDWKSSTPEQRNDACACFMPPSEVNPIRSWHVYLKDAFVANLTVETRPKADQWLAFVRKDEATLKRILPEIPWSRAAELQIVEHRRSLRYSDTPGGAWNLIEQLTSLGYLISIRAESQFTKVGAERAGQMPVGFMGDESFSELAAMLFLTLNGCQVIQ